MIPDKLSKTDPTVDYRPTTSTSIDCHTCVNIQLHGQQMATCALVEGTVDRVHVCDLFQAKS